jgi:hypothetical protein
MHKVKLSTGDGRFVANVLIPPFKTMPEVLRWGDRYFKFVSESEYSEVFCIAVLIEEPNNEVK